MIVNNVNAARMFRHGIMIALLLAVAGCGESDKSQTDGDVEQVQAEQAAAAANLAEQGARLWSQGDFDGAEQTFLSSLVMEEALGRDEGVANNYSKLGVVYHTRGELGKAEAMHRKALAIHTALNDDLGIGVDYASLGLLHFSRGQPHQAMAMYERALSHFERAGTAAVPYTRRVRELLEEARQLISAKAVGDLYQVLDRQKV